jgi:hypothetical protein
MNKVKKIFICWGIIVAAGPILLALVLGTLSDNVRGNDLSSLYEELILHIPANVLLYAGIPYAITSGIIWIIRKKFLKK